MNFSSGRLSPRAKGRPPKSGAYHWKICDSRTSPAARSISTPPWVMNVRAGLHAASLHERLFQGLKLLHVQVDAAEPSAPKSARTLTHSGCGSPSTPAPDYRRAESRAAHSTDGPCGHARPRESVGSGFAKRARIYQRCAAGVKLYFYSLTAHFGTWVETIGRQTHQWQVHAGLLYGQLAKHYHRRRPARLRGRPPPPPPPPDPN